MQPKLLCSIAFIVALLTFSSSWAQNNIVKGKVQDENGSPVPKASVLVKGSKSGTSTGDDGGFEISVPSNATLVISAIGFNRSEVKISGQATVTVALTPDNRSLNEVVVTALGVKREK